MLGERLAVDKWEALRSAPTFPLIHSHYYDYGATPLCVPPIRNTEVTQ